MQFSRGASLRRARPKPGRKDPAVHVSLSSDMIVKQRGRTKPPQNVQTSAQTPDGGRRRCTRQTLPGDELLRSTRKRRNPRHAQKQRRRRWTLYRRSIPRPSTPKFTKPQKTTATPTVAPQPRRNGPQTPGNRGLSPAPPRRRAAPETTEAPLRSGASERLRQS